MCIIHLQASDWLLQVNFFVGAFHDAVVRYGVALNETLTLGHDVTDGYAVTRRMWDQTHQG